LFVAHEINTYQMICWRGLYVSYIHVSLFYHVVHVNNLPKNKLGHAPRNITEPKGKETYFEWVRLHVKISEVSNYLVVRVTVAL
jgi:hypothetical protein